MTGCKTCVPIVEVRDSVRTVEVRTHDTTIVTEADSAQVRLLLRCDSANNVLIDEISAANGERLQMQAKIRSTGYMVFQILLVITEIFINQHQALGVLESLEFHLIGQFII